MARTSSGSARPKRGSSRSRSPLGFVGRFAAFVGASILAGALVAGIALPFVGGFGLTAKAASENFDDLPSDLDQPFLSQPSYILDSEGNQLAMVYDRYRILVNFDQISPIMRQAIVAIEDSRFYEHGPIDLKGTLRALMRNQQSGGTGSKQGGSSLTQQYVKNIFVEEAGNDPAKVAKAQAQEVSRKVKELKYAIGLEQRLSKDEILTRYLNITFFGRQAYGVEAASQRYFSKHAKDLTLTEAATLAGVVQAPSAYDPIGYPNAARERRNIVLQRMAEVKVISQVEADAAKATELNLKTQPLPNGCITADQIDGAAFFCDYVERVVKNDPAFGANKGIATGCGARAVCGSPPRWTERPRRRPTPPQPRAYSKRTRSPTRSSWSSRAAAGSRRWRRVGRTGSATTRPRSTTRSTTPWAARRTASRPARRSSRSPPRRRWRAG